MKNFEVVSMEALEPSHVLRLRYSDYIKYANREDKGNDHMYDFIISNLPGLEFKGINRKRNTIEAFEEVVSSL